jgi:hypothetical protein
VDAVAGELPEHARRATHGGGREQLRKGAIRNRGRKLHRKPRNQHHRWWFVSHVISDSYWMSKRVRYEVVPDGDCWRVTQDGRRLATTYGIKSHAIKDAEGLCHGNTPSQLIIKRANGTIEDERTYGSDPFPPEG